MLAPGTNLGPYTITGLLGVGGMGEVYRAHDSRLEREVAIKVLPSELSLDEKALERFRRETRAVAALSHPNILAIFDVGSEDGVHYAVTELLEGETLRGRYAKGPLTPRQAFETMLQIADGVAAAHARGIVHRDLKPENIFITTSGLVKVLDFGLARGGTGPIGEHSPTEILPTEPGVVLGTMGYAAPEQIEARGVSPATDVFALGCVLYEMVTTRLPFERGSAISQMVALLHEPAPRLTDDGDTLLRELDAIVQRCLSKIPAERLPNAGELANAIRDALAGRRTTARLPSPPRRRLFILGAVILALLAAGAIAYALHRARNRQIDHGYDLRVSDIRGDAETRRLIELALRADAEGNRAKAAELFEEAWRHPAKTALPAAFLSSFSDAAGNNPTGREWGRKAMTRLDASTPVYESLLARYLLVPSMNRQQELALAKSALDVRPDAWRLRLAAAHILLGQRDREAARREL
ncbi:MAG TPA: serine/threonine-protein kinase, partial [Thermoanaerobaculia bacterium]|nr:serine/threonine-protein kinase [Thermoanaerobaculia bacterium]